MRSSASVWVILPLLAGCGAIGAATGAIKGLAEASLESDLENQPYRVCAYDAPSYEVLDAMVTAFEEKGFELAEVDRTGMGLRAVPSSVSEGPNVGGRESWRLEIMEGFVYELKGRQIAYVAYQKGLSRSQDNWDYDMGGEFDDSDNDRRIERDDVEPDHSPRIYGDLMDRVSDQLGEPHCGG